MKKNLHGLFVTFGMMLGFFTVGVLSAHAQGVEPGNIKELAGYKSFSTLSSFAKHLQEDTALYQALQSNQQLSEKILDSTRLQRQLLTDIRRSGDSQSVISSYVNEFSQTGDVTSNMAGNAFGQKDTGQADSFTRQEEQRQKRRELSQQHSGDKDNRDRHNIQRLGGGVSGNANLAAQRAIEQAQRDREAADRRAKEALLQGQEQLDSDNKNQQAEFEAMMAQFKIVQELVSQLAESPAALEAFWADTAMMQKLIDKEMTIEAAMAELGVTPQPTDITPEPAPTEADTLFDSSFKDPATGTTPKQNQGLVHVRGNHYKIDGKDVWQTNYNLTQEDFKTDANGWPKYLNVPDFCAPPDENTTYFHALRIFSSNLSNYYKHPEISLSGVPYQTFTHGNVVRKTLLARGSMVAQPFITTSAPPASSQQNKTGIEFGNFTHMRHSAYGYDYSAVDASISLCPGDLQTLTNLDERRIKYKDKAGIMRSKKVRFDIQKDPEGYAIMCPFMASNVSDGLDANGQVAPLFHVGLEPQYFETIPLPEYRRCMLRPDTRYFLNVRPVRQEPVKGDKAEARRSSLPRQPFLDVAPEDTYGTHVTTSRSSGISQYPSFLPSQCPAEKFGQTKTTRCEDPASLLLPVLISQTCLPDEKTKRNEQICAKIVRPGTGSEERCWSTGDHGSWQITQGKDKKLFASHICTAVEARTTPEGVCAAHREGDMRKLVIVDRKGAGLLYNKKIEFFEQCQFHNGRKRFDWVSTGSRITPHKGRDFPRYKNVTQADLPDKKNCSMLGVTVEVGERLQMTCSNPSSNTDETLGMTCQRVAGGTMRPALVDENGFSFRRSKQRLQLMASSGDRVGTFVSACSLKKL